MVLALLVLMLDALAASPSLHELLHADAGRADHQCAVTLFAHGQVDSACAEVAAAAPLTFLADTPAAVISFHSSIIGQLPAGRAPPLSRLPV